jgi:hypothetical protein
MANRLNVGTRSSHAPPQLDTAVQDFRRDLDANVLMIGAGATNRLGNYLYFYLEINFLWLWYKSLKKSHLLSSISVKKTPTSII